MHTYLVSSPINPCEFLGEERTEFPSLEVAKISEILYFVQSEKDDEEAALTKAATHLKSRDLCIVVLSGQLHLHSHHARDSSKEFERRLYESGGFPMEVG
jgi:hypothetical protein